MAYHHYHSPAMAGTAHHPYQHQYQHLQGPIPAYQFQQAAASSSLQYPPQEMPNGGFAANDDDDDLPAVNMAGFGARNFARQQQEEARRRIERGQQRADEQHRARLAEERYYAAKRTSEEEQDQWEEEARIHRAQQEEARRQHEQQQELNRRQEQDRRHQHAKAMSSSSSPLARSIPLRNHSYSSSSSPSPSLRELRLPDVSARPSSRSSNAVSDAFWPPGSRSGSSRMSSASNGSSSGGSSSNSRLRPIQHTSIRKTVYEDDYEEADEMEFEGGGPRRSALSRSSYGQQELPLAKCANCRESLPFEELVDHVCLDKFESPMLSGPSTPMLTAATEMVRGASAPCRTPFLEKYAQVVEKSSSPLLQTSTLPFSSSPVSREWSSGNEQTSSAASDAAKRVEELRRERIRQIEEQRAAKQVISSKAPPSEEKYRPSGTKTHNRQPGSQASSSMSSTKSSTLGFTFATTPCTETMTPSSSVESVKSSQSERLRNEARDLIKQARAERIKGMEAPVKKPALDLDGVESLLKDMRTHDDTPKKADRVPTRSSSSGSTTTRSNGLNLTLASRSQRKAKKVCSICLQTFPKSHPMVEKNGKIFCIDDYAELYLEKCRKCTRPVRDVGVRSQDVALSGLFHRDCFSCFQCSAAFDDRTFYIFENAPYCGKHYHNLNGTTCHSCNQGIEGKCRQLETGERFHPHCLTCEYENGRDFCEETLTDYYVVKDKRMCEYHFEKIQNRLLGSGLGANIAEAARLRAGKRMTFMQTFEAKKGKA
jgi:hypothetical protein